MQGAGDLLDANLNIRKLRVPVLDLYADATPLNLSSAENRKALVGAEYRQICVSGASHSFEGYEPILSEAVADWLKERETQK